MATDASGVVTAKPVGLPGTISSENLVSSAAAQKESISDSLRISSRDMGKLTTEFCSYDGSADQGLEISKNVAKLLGPSGNGPYGGSQPENPEKPSELDAVRKKEIPQLFNNFILLANEPKRDWCKAGVSSSNWPYRSSSTNAPGYTLNKGYWAMARVFPWQDSDTLSFCEVHNDHLQTARDELPDEVRVMIEHQAGNGILKNLDDAGKADFYSRLDACVNTIRGAAEYVDFGGKRHDLKAFCVDVMKMASPDEKAEEKPAGGWSRWGGGAEDAEKTPVKRLEALLDERLLDIPWNRWIHREAFCKEARASKLHIVIGAIIDTILMVLVPIVLWALRFAIVVFTELVIIGVGTRFSNWFAKIGQKIRDKKGGGPDDPAAGSATGGGAAGAGAGQAAAAGAGTGAAQMSVATSRQMAPLGRYEADIAQAETPIPLWKRLVAGAQAAAGLSAGPNAAVFGGVQAGARAYLGTSVAVPLVP